MEAQKSELNPGLIDFINSVDRDLGRDPDSLELFQWIVEDHYDAIMEDMLDYFQDRPDMQAIQAETALLELGAMLKYFEEKEEYEKCSKLVEVQKEMKSRFIEEGLLNP
jgi:hypothetical protein